MSAGDCRFDPDRALAWLREATKLTTNNVEVTTASTIPTRCTIHFLPDATFTRILPAGRILHETPRVRSSLVNPLLAVGDFGSNFLTLMPLTSGLRVKTLVKNARWYCQN